MRTSPSSPWIVRCSVQLYRWLLCLGSQSYRRQYADRTLQLFRECCQDAYREHGTRGVLSLWPALFSDVVVQMLGEHLSELQRASQLRVSVETVSADVSERTPSMSSRWQRINRRWFIPAFSAITVFRRKITRPFLKKLYRPRLKHPTNMHFERNLYHWRFIGGPPLYECSLDPTALQATGSAFLKSTTAEAEALATLRQTIKADEYRGKHLRFSGDVKVEHVEQRAGLWVEPIVPPHRREARLQPENVVQGTHEWMIYQETVFIPEDALFIRYGIVLHGKGQVWLANPHLEVIEQDAMQPV